MGRIVSIQVRHLGCWLSSQVAHLSAAVGPRRGRRSVPKTLVSTATGAVAGLTAYGYAYAPGNLKLDGLR
jgi:hypothetical protein